MKSSVTVEIDAPQSLVAGLFADPGKTVEWMDDVERYEPISGAQGMPGSTYRLVLKKGSMVFVATVVSRSLPNELRLKLEASNVTVAVNATLFTVSGGRTRFVSEEEFTFKGLFSSVFSLFAEGAIRSAHRRHIEAFKRFAERSSTARQ